jgi:glycosyltransferase involved in cell wall biosynthesis
LRAAAKRSDLEPVLVINEGLVSYGIARRFLRSTPDLRHFPLETPWHFGWLAFFLVWLMYDVFPHRIWRGRVFKRLNYLKLRKKPELKYDVLYSFYDSLENSKRTDARARFLLVHDILPVLRPHYFGRKEPAAWFLNIMKSVDPQKDWIACNSLCTKRDYCDYLGFDPARAFVTPLAAEDYFRPVDEAAQAAMRARLRLPAGRYLLSLCTLEPRKNLVHVIRCFLQTVAENRGQLADVNLLLAGAKGWQYDAIFKEVEASPDLKSRIVFLGRVSDEDIAALYSAASGFLYLSLYEGFGLPPLEAMQCGTPVVASNTSSLPEVVGDAGLMIDPTDEAALRQAILSLLTDSNLRNELSRRGIERARQFSWNRFMDETMTAFRQALAAP